MADERDGRNSGDEVQQPREDSDPSARPPRVWPGVLVVGLYWAWILASWFVQPGMFQKFMGIMATTALMLLAFPLWWAVDRRRRGERLVVLGAFVGFGAVATLLASPSFQIFGWFLFVLPWVFTAWATWALVTRRASLRVRRAGLVVVLALAWGVFTLARAEGLSGEGQWQLRWRWTPTSEERFLAGRHASTASSGPSTTPSVVRAVEGDWPAFRGVARNGVVQGVRIGTDWSAAPPKVAWREQVGPGWSSVIVLGGRLYTQEQRGEAEAVVCRDAASGREVWAHTDATRFTEVMSGAGPRSTPTFADGRVYAMGGTGLLNCLDAASGEKRWQSDVKADAGANLPVWGFSSSPLVVDGRVIVFAGGAGTNGLVAYDTETGQRAWGVETGQNSYSSAEVADVAGERIVLFWGEKTLTALDPASGATRWSHTVGGTWGTLQPRVVGGDRIVLTSDAGTTAIRVRHESDHWTTEPVWKLGTFNPQFNDFVVHGGFAYGLAGGNVCCFDLTTGKMRWRKGRYGYGQLLLLADQGLLVVACESGEVALVSARPDRHEELGRFEAVSGKTWGHPTVAHGRLYVRSAEELACFELPVAKDATSKPTP